MSKTCFLILLFSVLALQAKETTTTSNTSKRKPSQLNSMSIVPLDASTAEAINSTELSKHVKAVDEDQKLFIKKAYSVGQKIYPLIPDKHVDPLFFVYDCLFMSEEGFYLKYGRTNKVKLESLRKSVLGEFND